MDPSYDTTQIDPLTLQTLLSGSETSLIPESLVTTLIVSFILLNVLGVLFFIFYVLGIIRKWKVQSAVLHMQKDIAEIKTALAKPAPVSPAQPATQNAVIARQDSDDAKA
jgi:hypothetical protein